MEERAKLTRGELAKQGGVNIETIRYYEQRGLLPKPPRSQAGYRLFSLDDVQRVRFIKRAQQLGFTLEEVTSLLTLEDGRSCRETRLLAEQKLAIALESFDLRIEDRE